MKKEIVIEGMDCEHCITRIKNALKSVKAIEDITVSLEEKIVLVASSKEIPDSVLREAIENDEAGYDVVCVRAV